MKMSVISIWEVKLPRMFFSIYPIPKQIRVLSRTWKNPGYKTRILIRIDFDCLDSNCPNPKLILEWSLILPRHDCYIEVSAGGDQTFSNVKKKKMFSVILLKKQIYIYKNQAINLTDLPNSVNLIIYKKRQ
jgi:hypothetical protein